MAQEIKKNTGTDKRNADPQEKEKDGNIFGKAFEKLAGDSSGDNSISEDESKEPGKKGSIKE
jgi:hypothetical protein